MKRDTRKTKGGKTEVLADCFEKQFQIQIASGRIQKNPF